MFSQWCFNRSNGVSIGAMVYSITHTLRRFAYFEPILIELFFNFQFSRVVSAKKIASQIKIASFSQSDQRSFEKCYAIIITELKLNTLI